MEFRILGPFDVVKDGEALLLGSGRQRALLAFLLLNANHAVSIERLVDELWGDEPPEKAVKVIQTYVSRLRKVLPEGILVTRPPGYVAQIELAQLDLHAIVHPGGRLFRAPGGVSVGLLLAAPEQPS